MAKGQDRSAKDREMSSMLKKTGQAESITDDQSATAAAIERAQKSGDALEVKVSHAFARDTARVRVGYLLDYWQRRFGVRSAWAGSSVYLTGRVWGVEVRAIFDVGEHEVVAHSTDPGFLFDPGFLLRSRITNYVEKKLRKYLHPTYDDP